MDTNTQKAPVIFTSNTKSGSYLESPPTTVNNQLAVQDEYIQESNSKSNWHWIQVTMVCAIKLILSIIAGYLSWGCSAGDNIFIRIIITIFSILFSDLCRSCELSQNAVRFMKLFILKIKQ